MKTDQEKLHEEFRELCSAHQYKCTAQRFAVYCCMKDNTTHPSVDQIWEDVRKTIPSITRESVFRILLELVQMRVVTRMDKIIDARFDGRPENHGHLICERCGAIIDFKLPENLPAFPEESGFQAHHTELRISGLCADCTKKAAEAAKKQRKE